MNPFYALGTKHLNRMLDAPGNSLRCLDNVVLDVDYTQSKWDILAQLLKSFQLIVASPRELEHEMINIEGIKEVHDVFPETLLNGLPTVILIRLSV